MDSATSTGGSSKSSRRGTKDSTASELSEGRSVVAAERRGGAEGKRVNVVEIPISSDPMIRENTGFRGDSHLPLLVAALNMDDDDDDDNHENEDVDGVDGSTRETNGSTAMCDDDVIREGNDVMCEGDSGADMKCNGNGTKHCDSEHAQEGNSMLTTQIPSSERSFHSNQEQTPNANGYNGHGTHETTEELLAATPLQEGTVT